MNAQVEKMLVVPPRHYCSIRNPVNIKADGTPEVDAQGQAKVKFGEVEIRLHQEPFPLYPGEILCEKVTPLKVVAPDSALRIRAFLDFVDNDGRERFAGDEWLFEGPGTFIPRKETTVLETVRASVIQPGQGLILRAKKECEDRDGNKRYTGEKWLVKKNGAYLPSAYEEVVETVKAYVLTDQKALHMRCLQSFTDDFGVKRKNGEEWLITMSDTESHIPSVNEDVVGVVRINTLTNRQYCVVLDCVGANGKPQFGKKKLISAYCKYLIFINHPIHFQADFHPLVTKLQTSTKGSRSVQYDQNLFC